MEKNKGYPEYHYHDAGHQKWWQGERLMNRLLVIVLMAVAAMIVFIEYMA